MLKPLIHLSVALSLIVLPIAPAHAGKHDPLFTPAPIEVPAGTSVEAVRKAIRKSLFDRGWESRELGPGHIQAKYVKQLPKLNLFGYGQVESPYGSGEFYEYISELIDKKANVVASRIPDREAILGSIKEFLGTGK